MADGSVSIEAILSTDKFDKQINNLEKKMQKEEQKKIVIESKLGVQQQELDKARAQVDKLADSYQKLKSAQIAVESKKATPEQFSNFFELQNAFGSLEELDSKFQKALLTQDKIESKVLQTKRQYQELTDTVSDYKNKIEGIKLQKQQAEVEKMREGFKGVGSSIQDTVKKAGKLVLGIFAIRSAYLAIRRASSELASYDEQYATDLEYIRYVLTQAIAPVLKGIVSLAMQLLGLINAVLNALFGINLFSKGSAESFNKMKAGASGASKVVKEIKKQLAGFDEINMLTDQSDTGTAGGAGGVGMPSMDLSALQGERPEWLEWLVKNKDLIIAVLFGIAEALVAIKLGLDPITSLGLGLMVGGLLYAIEGIIQYLNDPSWKNFGKIIQGIGVFVIGLGVAFLGLPAIITGVVVLILGTIIKYWEQIKGFLQNGIDWLTEKSEWIHQMFGDVIGNIYDTFVKNLQLILNIFDSTFKMLKGILDGIIQFVKGVFTGNWSMAWEGVKKIFSSVWDGVISILQNVIQILKNTVINIAQTAGNIVANTFKKIVNAVLSAIESLLNSPINSINGLISVINQVPGINLSRLSTFNFPRLKQGAILNVPNKGTLVGGGRAIAGEAGHEGYLPLTDQQAMAELGREIGKNVLVNLTNITRVGNRTIAREIKQINAEQNFAYNV